MITFEEIKTAFGGIAGIKEACDYEHDKAGYHWRFGVPSHFAEIAAKRCSEFYGREVTTAEIPTRRNLRKAAQREKMGTTSGVGAQAA